MEVGVVGGVDIASTSVEGLRSFGRAHGVRNELGYFWKQCLPVVGGVDSVSSHLAVCGMLGTMTSPLWG